MLRLEGMPVVSCVTLEWWFRVGALMMKYILISSGSFTSLVLELFPTCIGINRGISQFIRREH